MILATEIYLQFIYRLPQTVIYLFTGNNADDFCLFVQNMEGGLLHSGSFLFTFTGVHKKWNKWWPHYLPNRRSKMWRTLHFSSVTKCTPLSKNWPKNPYCFFQVEWMFKTHYSPTTYQRIGWSIAILSNKGQWTITFDWFLIRSSRSWK